MQVEHAYLALMRGAALLRSFPLAMAVAVPVALAAQDNELQAGWSVAVEGAAVVPVGEITSYTVQQDGAGRSLAGPALPGPGLLVSMMHDLGPHWSLGGTLGLAHLRTDDLSQAELFYNPCAACGGLGGGTVRTGYTQQQGDRHVTQVLAEVGVGTGPGLWSVGLTASLGAQHTRTPEVQVTEEGTVWDLDHPQLGTYSSTLVQPSVDAWSLVLGGGARVERRAGAHLALRAGADLRTTTVGLPYRWDRTTASETVYGTYSNSTHSEAELREQMMLWWLHLGIVYRLGRTQ